MSISSNSEPVKRRQSCSRRRDASVYPVYYPLLLNLSDKKAVVIGGGKVAERKIPPLLKAGAQVTVISPDITTKIEQMKRQKIIRHITRPYRKGDLRGAFLVIAATDSSDVNERVSRDAPCLVNIVDTPHLCNFIVPSTMVRGPLNIAVSTSGISPALSRSIRKELQIIYGAEFAKYLQSLRKIRHDAMQMIHDKKKRTELLKCIASEEMIRKVRGKGSKEMKKMAEGLLEKAKRPMHGQPYQTKH
jgi:precorrin-2 dehydrogenase / sirohydrochlorin ferrochelatase